MEVSLRLSVKLFLTLTADFVYDYWHHKAGLSRLSPSLWRIADLAYTRGLHGAAWTFTYACAHARILNIDAPAFLGL